MTAPNIVNVSVITGKTAAANITTNLSNVIANPNSSNKVFKINSLYVSNGDANFANGVTIEVRKGSNSIIFAANVSVPIRATIDIITKAIYLEEEDVLQMKSSANSVISAVASYEEIS